MKLSTEILQAAERLHARMQQLRSVTDTRETVAGIRLTLFFNPPQPDENRVLPSGTAEIEIKAGSPSFEAVRNVYFAELEKATKDAQAEAAKLGIEF